KTVVLSAHVLHSTPPAAALLGLIDRAEALGADVTKLVTHARDLDDLRVLLEVTLVARARGIVTLATGPAGPLSRVVLPAAGPPCSPAPPPPPPRPRPTPRAAAPAAAPSSNSAPASPRAASPSRAASAAASGGGCAPARPERRPPRRARAPRACRAGRGARG